MLLCTISTLIGAADTKTTSGHVTLRAGLIGGGSLENFTNINVGHATAEVLGTLKTSVRTTNMEVTHNCLDIPRAGTGGNLVKPLQGDSTPKVIDCSSNYRTAGSRKARSIHKIGMLNVQRELIGRRFGDIDACCITKTFVDIRNESRGIFCNLSSALILDKQLQRTIGLNRTTFANDRQLDIRATLRSRQSRSEVVFKPTTGKKITKKTPFPIGTIFRIIGRQISVTRSKNLQFVIDVLIAVILIPNQTITPEGKSGNRSGSIRAIGNTTGSHASKERLQGQTESGSNTVTGVVSPITFSVTFSPNRYICLRELIPR